MKWMNRFPVMALWELCFFCYCCCFFAVLEFELRFPHWLGKCSTTWAMPPVLFALVILEIGSWLLSRPAWTVHNPPILCSLQLLGWQVHTTMPNYWLGWGLTNFLPRAGLEPWSSWSHPPKELGLLGISHWSPTGIIFLKRLSQRTTMNFMLIIYLNCRSNHGTPLLKTLQCLPTWPHEKLSIPYPDT
jgi:hypothetical protein